MPHRPKALIVCNDTQLSWSLPHLLSRAGFRVDALSKSGILKKSFFLHKLIRVPYAHAMAPSLIALIESDPSYYDWIVICEDPILHDVLRADAPEHIKLKILPVRSAADFPHLASKIGLAEALARHNVPAPPFKIAHNMTEAETAAHILGYPLIAKIDSSSGGEGIHECTSPRDLRNLAKIFTGAPVLLQKKMEGDLVDLSAIFFEGQLAFFSYSHMVVNEKDFGPSIVRHYLPMQSVKREIVEELQKLGAATGAHGFTNISCIEQNDQRFYFEADMRPNAWVDFPTYFANDPAEKIKAWFTNRTILHAADFHPAGQAQPLLQIPHFLRLGIFEFIFNRYKVWNYIPRQDRSVTLRLLLKRFLLRYGFALARFVMPYELRQNIKSALAQNGIF